MQADMLRNEMCAEVKSEVNITIAEFDHLIGWERFIREIASRPIVVRVRECTIVVNVYGLHAVAGRWHLDQLVEHLAHHPLNTSPRVREGKLGNSDEPLWLSEHA